MRTPARLLLALGSGLALTTTPALGAQAAPPDTGSLTVGRPSVATSTPAKKINVMGLWAHPDDDASFITPCGVWHDRYGVTCGVIQLTRGEGGSNSVGTEQGPALGLRRENEDRAAHYRSGTVDIFNIDQVDFYYNTSAPLTEQIWGSEKVQRQVVHVIRQTRPDVLVGFPPDLSVGHGNHQYAGRVIWEAARMAADPTVFPDQLTGRDAVKTWQVKTITSGGLTTGTGGIEGPGCNAGFTPAASNPFTVVGTWTGYPSPYSWPKGNVQGQPAGTPMSWAQVGREGFMAYPTQARSKFTTLFTPTAWAPSCVRYGIAQSTVPFQPNGSAANARDDAILFGSVIPDPGGMPLGSTFQASVKDYFQAPGVPFDVTVSARSGRGTVRGGTVTLDLPSGWTYTPVSGARRGTGFGDIRQRGTTTQTFRVTPAAGAALGTDRIGVHFSNGSVTAYTDTRVELVAGVEGRVERWGNFGEYETWADTFSHVSGRSQAVRQIGVGEAVTIPVVVTNRTTTTQSGTVQLGVQKPLVVDRASAAFSNLAPGASTTVKVVVTHTDKASAGGTTVAVPVTTTSGTGTSTEQLTLYVVPTTVIPHAATAPVVDGKADDAGYGPALDIGRKWEGSDCSPDGTDCGKGSTVRLAWHDDALYALATVVDDKASVAAPPNRCTGHWLVDSVEFLLDPMSGSRDTSTTFKTGVMPFTDDPTGSAGNGVNGPCWSRDADNHQGYSSGPLASTVKDAPNAPGEQVAVQGTRNADGTYAGGKYTIEVKIPLADLPAAVATSAAPTGVAGQTTVDPHYLGLNVTPYDSDVDTYIGKTRLAWSPFGSQQSEPYRWGHAYLDGYTAPAGRSTTASAPIIPDTALKGVESPQTIYQSATRGVTIAGLPASHGLVIRRATVSGSAAALDVRSRAKGTVRVYAYAGNPTASPVWKSTCPGDTFGFGTCAADDVKPADWAPDMAGRLVASTTVDVAPGTSTVRLALDAAQQERLRRQGSLLVSYESTSGGVDAWYFPLKGRS